MKILAIIVTYNPMHWADKCFGSLVSSNIPIDIFVVDNGSTDGGQSYIKQHWSNIIFHQSEINLGFARANNIGLRYAVDNNYDYVFLLNQDAWIEKDTIEKLLLTCQNADRVGVVSPMQLTGDYSALDKRFANYLSSELISDVYLNSIKSEYEVEMVSAAAWLLPISTIQRIGGFDTLLFTHYGEDDNYAQRVQYYGLKLYINPQCTICHDRATRTADQQENNYKKFNSEGSQFVKELNILANINYDINIIQEIKKHQRFYLLNMLSGHLKTAMKHKDKIKLLYKIDESRKKNKQIGLNWLNK